MFAIASVFDPSIDHQVRDYWARLESLCGLQGIKMTPLPHISWQGAESYDFAEVEAFLEEFTAKQKPFELRMTGLGVFTSPSPVLYLPVVKNLQIVQFHESLWESIFSLTHQANEYYSPERWMPHVTLAYKDLTPQRLCCALEALAFEPINLTATVRELSVLYFLDDGQTGVKRAYPFGGSL